MIPLGNPFQRGRVSILSASATKTVFSEDYSKAFSWNLCARARLISCFGTSLESLNIGTVTKLLFFFMLTEVVVASMIFSAAHFSRVPRSVFMFKYLNA
jgi:hypothetical protein